MEPIRVLHVINEMVLEGAESRIMDLYRNLDTDKVQFDFAVHTVKPAYFDNEIRQRGGRIYRWPEFNVSNLFKYIKEVNSFFKEHREYRIVHGHIISWGFIYHWIAKKHGVKTRIAHARTSSYEKTLRGYMTLLMLRPLKYFANVYFACSKLAGEYAFGKKNVETGRVRIINNAIDAGRFRFSPADRERVRKEFSLEEELVIGHVGTFRYAKNHPFLLDVFAEIVKTRPDAVLLLVGDGKLKQDIIEKARSLDIYDRIIFAGQRTDVPKLLSAMDVLVFPSHYEGLPGVVVEAQAAGLRCFVSDAVSQEVAITDLVQFISLKESPKFWAERVLEKVGYPRKDMCSEIASAGFDVKTVAEELQEFYLNCAGSSPCGQKSSTSVSEG